MKCQRIRKAIVGGKNGERIRRHLEICPACAAWVERNERLCRLLQSQGRQIDGDRIGDLEARLRAGFWREIEQTGSAFTRRWLPTLSLPLARYAIAAVFIGMLTFHWLATPPPNGASRLSPMAAQSAGRVGRMPDPLPLWRSNVLLAPEFFVASPLGPGNSPLSVTNMGAAGIQPGIGFRFVSHSE